MDREEGHLACTICCKNFPLVSCLCADIIYEAPHDNHNAGTKDIFILHLLLTCRDQLRLPGDPAQRVAGGDADDAARRGDLPLPGGDDLRGAVVQDHLPGRRQVEPPATKVLW